MIAEALTSYAAACQRVSIDRRPLVWADHFDIWNTERGEIGLAPSNPDGQATVAFAALIPFVLVPEIGASVLVLDLSTLGQRTLSMTELVIENSEISTNHCWVPFGIDDDGSFHFGDVKQDVSPFMSTQTLAAIDRVTDGRREHFAWDENLSFDASIRVATEVIRQLAPTEF